ncbi:unnamed protein product, partial [marine sediment metagenome]
EELLNKIVTEGDFRIEISSSFFGGDLLAIDKAIEILREASYFNIVGENICVFCFKSYLNFRDLKPR